MSNNRLELAGSQADAGPEKSDTTARQRRQSELKILKSRACEELQAWQANLTDRAPHVKDTYADSNKQFAEWLQRLLRPYLHIVTMPESY